MLIHRTTSRGAAALVILAGAFSLVGWLFNVDALKSIYGSITIKGNTSLALLLAGLALCFLNSSEAKMFLRRTGQACAVIVLLIGLLTLSEHIFGWNLGIDQLLFAEPAGSPATASPGRMGLPASTCLALSATAMLLLYAGRAIAQAQLLAVVVQLWAVLALTGYAYGAQELYGIAGFTGIALHTAFALFVLGAGIFASRADAGIVSLITSDWPGAAMTRRLLLAAVVIPPLLGWLRLAGQRVGYFDLGFGTAMMVVTIMFFFSFFVWHTGSRMRVIEKQRQVERDQTEKDRELMLAKERVFRTEAERANRLKDEFLATVSHELRTPLTAILGWSKLVQAGRLEADGMTRAMDSIQRNAQWQAQLIDDLLDISRITSGKLQITVTPIDILSVVNAVMDAIRPAAEAKDIRIDCAAGRDIGEVDGDSARLQQIIWNLLTNAVKFTPARGTVRVAVDQSASAIRLSVSDTGEGISPEFLPHVFERFRQADGTPSRKHEGLGLGLSIARHLADMHGGTIEAYSDGLGKGAVFTLTLPTRSNGVRTCVSAK
jgi:signal transduction histidine kinase